MCHGKAPVCRLVQWRWRDPWVAVRSGSVGGAAGELLDELEQAGMVESAVALGHEGGDQLGDHGAERDHHSCLAGRGLDDAEVLVVQLEAAAGLEGPGPHASPLRAMT